MNTIESIRCLARLFVEATGMPISSLSLKIFNDVKVLAERLPNGGDLRTRRAEYALAWFSIYWPADLAWPEEINRPRNIKHRPAADARKDAYARKLGKIAA